MEVYRHGDILVARTDRVPKGAKRVPHLVLAEGELTGHSHRIAERDAAIIYEAAGRMYLSVSAEAATLIHQEHGPISLPRGIYTFWRQREYSPREIRFVRD